MNETIQSNIGSNAPWPTSDQRVPMPDATTLPYREKDAPAAPGLLDNAVQGAHKTIDRIAESAEPAARQLGDSVAAATEALHTKTDQLRETRDEWVEGARGTVRSNPLASVAAAFALGVLFARITR
ncbi:MAG: hypothetical protein KJ614_12175 [Gammaproteobacteria bacterium]|uniref:hypothetical protein n=1 Tax=Rhodoferax sp. TaxID=50421 RepID=UPI0017C5E268|nr:hypothetical protein [Rhodoferax sp.]MBU3899661.1 hypothetical protein [Gammaproteobacteria bacterium]MBA3056374.1 hypothetical protein [Rhodoferax sp.]MBU3997417.1 hypothetical protein [Gammaproteobacteria bacterium]MBU4018137.1 hypothetical protein [Gammaproteobacteria bacterium]MBU4080172.1 hypothetical protein [Gammaproteobacteria bacterium]